MYFSAMLASTEYTATAIVADDLLLVTEGLASLCAGFSGCRVLAYSSDGEQAWDLIEGMKPDVALLNSYLPGMTALDIVRKSRQNSLPTRFIVLAQRGDRQNVIEVLRAGASGFLLKSTVGRHLEDAFHQVCQGGVYIDPTIALDGSDPTHPRNLDDPLKDLSGREMQVFTLLVEGARAKHIAAQLSLSPKTVDTYRASLMRKLDIHDVPGLVKLAIRHKVTAAGQ